MAKYTKRKDGRYCTHVDTGRYDELGKRIRITVYGRTQKELEDKIAAIRHQTNTGTFCKSSSMGFGQYAELWLSGRKPTIENATYNIYKLIIDKHIDFLRNMPLSKIVKSDVQDCINEASDTYAIQCKLRLVVNQVFNSAVDDNLIPKNPCMGVKLPNHINSEKRPLTAAEKKALKYCDFTSKELAFVYLLYFTGIRRGEALALSKSDIDFNTFELRVSKSVTFIDKNHPEIKAPKSQASVRTIYMPAALISVLKPYIDTLDSHYLFSGKSGQIMSYSGYNKMWKRIYAKINKAMGGTDYLKATDLTPHIFRHNYATMLYYQGVDVKQAQKLLGHSNIKTTLEIYTHYVSDETLSKTLDALAL